MNTCYVYVLSTRDHHHLAIRATADLRHGIRHHRRRIAARLGHRRVFLKVLLIESFSGLSAAVERQKELEGLSRAELFALVSRCNPTWKTLSIRRYLARQERGMGGNARVR